MPKRSAFTCRLIVLAKEPVPGQVKTRLCPPFTLLEAAALAEAALADTLAAVLAAVPQGRHRGLDIRPVLALDGAAHGWLDELLELAQQPPLIPRLPVIPQRSGGLDLRLAGAFEDATADAHGPQRPALLIGMDTPQVTASLLVESIEALATPGSDAVIGPADDGGWWALGLRRPDRSLLVGVPMSSPRTGAVQRDRLTRAGLEHRELPVLIDVDTAADADAVAKRAPRSRFATTLRRLTPALSVPG